MTWIDTVVVTIIVAGGCFIMYRALQEPVDHVFRLLGKLLSSIKESIGNKAEGGYETISYG